MNRMTRFAKALMRSAILVVLLFVGNPVSRTSARPMSDNLFDIIMPAVKKSVVKENTIALAGKVNDPSVATVTLYRSCGSSQNYRFRTAAQRVGFVAKFTEQWHDEMLGASVKVMSRKSNGDSVRIEKVWDFSELPTRQQFWATKTGKTILAQLDDEDTRQLEVQFSGWLTGSAILRPGTGQTWFNSSLLLTEGDNRVIIVGQRADKSVVGTDSIHAYFYIDNIADQPPSGFQKYTFHATPAEAECRVCHAPKPFLARDACAPCHDGLWNQRFTHTPTRQRKCMECHDSTVPTFKIKKAMGTDADLCYTCHKKQKEAFGADSMKRHAPVDQGMCVQCHTPHSSPNVMHTLLPINKLCLSCHPNHDEYLHPVVNHPHHGVDEGVRPGRELSCAGCHEPHAIQYDKMLRYGQGMNGCVKCHPK